MLAGKLYKEEDGMKKKKASTPYEIIRESMKKCEEMIHELDDQAIERLKTSHVKKQDIKKAVTDILEAIKSIQETYNRKFLYDMDELQERRKEQTDKISKVIIAGEFIEKELMKKVENLAVDDPLRKSLLFVSQRGADLKMMKLILDQQIMGYEVARKEYARRISKSN